VEPPPPKRAQYLALCFVTKFVEGLVDRNPKELLIIKHNSLCLKLDVAISIILCGYYFCHRGVFSSFSNAWNPIVSDE